MPAVAEPVRSLETPVASRSPGREEPAVASPVRSLETPIASRSPGREEPAVAEAPPILAVSSTLPAELPDKATTADDPAAMPAAPVEPNISLHAELNTPFNISAP